MIGAQGLGWMGMSDFYGATDEIESRATLERAGTRCDHVRYGGYVRLGAAIDGTAGRQAPSITAGTKGR